MLHAEKSTRPETLKEKLHNAIDRMDEYQLRLVWSFLKTLFKLSD